jgi:hypothetical protein
MTHFAEALVGASSETRTQFPFEVGFYRFSLDPLDSFDRFVLLG